jgi:hypothetical protein
LTEESNGPSPYPQPLITPRQEPWRFYLPVLFIILLLLLDQLLKFWVKTHMQLGDEIKLAGDWAKLNSPFILAALSSRPFLYATSLTIISARWINIEWKWLKYPTAA